MYLLYLEMSARYISLYKGHPQMTSQYIHSVSNSDLYLVMVISSPSSVPGEETVILPPSVSDTT